MILILYHFESCPYCKRVRDFMAAAGIDIPLRDIHKEPLAREELIKTGGKSQVPCLSIDGKALYESLDIINWLKKYYNKGHQSQVTGHQ